MTPTTLKIFWVLIFGCSIRGLYANAAKKEIAYTIAFFITTLFSLYMIGDLFGYVSPDFWEKIF